MRNPNANPTAQSPNRRSIRLRGYDYSRKGAYFLTIVARHRECLFGEIVDGQMQLNDAGRIVYQCWNNIPSHFPNVNLDIFVVMPNHIHGIVVLDHAPGSGSANNHSPALDRQYGQNQRPRGTSKTIGSIVRGFKIGVTKWMRNYTPGIHVWQRNYWEHVVRDEPDLSQLREYIENNPRKWELDQLHPSQT